ncbi:Coenzyme F420 hydrogenase/dehydrogenase, beta subunit C-terminal domain [uncultured Sphaerochaeta sp.]|uniref:Coenzyme F420 hydrogenase/dehydrogenase, beta subunit C-terminal domain n=1 Tax=uncultured Sphaerochaeta sp. TaxID=886478 RepID=UPI002A0A4EC6|nr:Coenzyme F420 hydrogenase/dehydrogenase, beta subunit C-terminal domain [uncultured Sphaerochaeta sp.]
MAIQITEEKDCIGCTACQAICPMNCISLHPDDKGFVYPLVEATDCIECGLCTSTCPLLAPVQKKSNNPTVYAAKARDRATLLKSSSGGMFIPLSETILSKGGVVYGAAFTTDLVVEHIRCTTAQQRDRCVGSKYVQSNMETVLPQVKKDLASNLQVMFTGTPCQVAGLRSFLKNAKIDTSNLFCCDLLCYGVPSPKVWQDYLATLTKGKGEQVSDAFFRDKTQGWNDFSLRIETEHTTTLESNSKNLFLQLYLEHLTIRPSCFDCHFTNLNREGDLTLGDYWGIEQALPEFADPKGVSVVLVNSPKGKAWLEEVQDSLELRESSARACMQSVLSHPLEKPIGYELFWDEYGKKGFEETTRQF